MSDYFGALLRSAGAVPAAAGARALQAGEADLVEQDVEVEAGAAPASVRASRSPEAPVVIEPTPQPPAEPTLQSPAESTPQASPKPHEVGRREPASSLFTRPAVDDEVHPVVRAALQWVTENSGPAERTLPDAAEAQIVSDSPSRRPVPQVSTSPARALPPHPARPMSAVEHPARPVSPVEHAAERRQERPAAEPLRAAPAHELDFTLPRAPRARPEGVATTEVSIGTIHVSVDAAPPTRTVVQPTPSPPRPQPARPAQRSGFARCRLPRF